MKWILRIVLKDINSIISRQYIIQFYEIGVGAPRHRSVSKDHHQTLFFFFHVRYPFSAALSIVKNDFKFFRGKHYDILYFPSRLSS